MCRSRKYVHTNDHPTEGNWLFQGVGWVSQKQKISKGKYGVKLEFLEGWGGIQPFMAEVWTFYGTTQYNYAGCLASV